MIRTAIRTGEPFAGYELEERISDSTGLGVLYRARDMNLERLVALRIIPPNIAGDTVTRARLNREATILASLSHPNVAPIFNAGCAGDSIFIATQWVDGVDLNALIRKEGPLPPARAVRIVNQVAAALQSAHDQGVMHRDVKPTNVLVTPTDHAYLINFAVARRSTDMTGLTAHEQLQANFDYTPPEYIEGAEIDWRVDIYGLGCLLYEALTAEVPYPRSGSPAKMYAHLSVDPPSPRTHRPETPAKLDAVVTRAIAKDRADRQQSASEFAIDAAGALDLSVPHWTRPSGFAVGSGGASSVAGSDARPRHQPAGAEVHADFSEQHVYRAGPRVAPLRALLWVLGLVLFLAPPIALVIALHSA